MLLPGGNRAGLVEGARRQIAWLHRDTVIYQQFAPPRQAGSVIMAFRGILSG
jgi:hypothetical protein